ncbi:RNA polymerase sigma factor [Mycobacterium sp. WMMD1722]|uniref:RNA polymerase sigma factor n=1 Tax=Mycobacterium sp. WMMD1722 TaxID=3404117 RepID=UPI003BF5D2AA
MSPPETVTTAFGDEAELLAALRRRDASAYADLVDRHTPAMLRVARGYVRSDDVAEEVVQETWIALMKGIYSFEGRSSLRTWLFAVLINVAKRRGVRERRDALVPVRSQADTTVDPSRFRGPADPYPGHWLPGDAPVPFPDTPEGSVLGEEMLTVTRHALDRLPDRQRTVVAMRDVLGMDSAEVCAVLDISVANQRVLLHRGRAALRQLLEDYLREPS